MFKFSMFLCFICTIIFSASLYDTEYDKEIKDSVNFYWNDFPEWKFYKAQLYQESLLDINATSHAGAKGIAQFMPTTWLDMQKRMNIPDWATPYMPEYSIRAGAYYMRSLRNSWNWNRPILEKHYLALASYNAGLGNILYAQNICKKIGRRYKNWKDIKECLEYITGKHSKETKTYVDRVIKWYKLLNN